MGPILTEVSVWLPGLFAGDSGLTSYKSDVQTLCWLPGVAVTDGWWLPALLAADTGQSSIFFFFFFFLGPHVQNMKVPRLGLNRSYRCQPTSQFTTTPDP